MRKILLVLLVALCACSDDSTTVLEGEWARPEAIHYSASLNVDLSKMNRSASGLYWQDIKVGEADSAKFGDNVRVHYTGWLPDGMQFDSTRDRSPIEFPLGYGLVLRGVDEGVMGMRVGGIRRLVLKPELAFGVTGRPSLGIPSNATIIVEVERLTTPAH